MNWLNKTIASWCYLSFQEDKFIPLLIIAEQGFTGFLENKNEVKVLGAFYLQYSWVPQTLHSMTQ